MDGSTADSGWVTVGPLDDIPVQGARRVETARGPIAIFRTVSGAVYALEDRCPHKAGPLSEGIVHGGAVSCPLHNWTIDLASGEAASPDRGCTPTVPVRIEDDIVLIFRPVSPA